MVAIKTLIPTENGITVLLSSIPNSPKKFNKKKTNIKVRTKEIINIININLVLRIAASLTQNIAASTLFSVLPVYQDSAESSILIFQSDQQSQKSLLVNCTEGQ